MANVRSGLDRLLDAGPAACGLAPNARVALVAHPASVDAGARHALPALLAAGTLRVERLFAPEHGVGGHEQDMEPVRGSSDPRTGLPVVSLYGDTAESLKPRREDLDGLDAVVFDLQDIGSRYYTFVYTLSFLMEAARDAGVRVVVLDRPNPLGGTRVEGPVLEPSLASFVGRYPIPVRHGLTTGELARLFNEAFGIGCDLHVVAMDGWRRAMEFEATGLPWVPPSPNMPSMSSATVYPGGCLVEGTNLSEGRGTTTPFELVGAPWLDGTDLLARLRAEGLTGVLFREASFRPQFHKHAGRACPGLQVIVSDRNAFRPFSTFLVLLREARAIDPARFAWRTEPYEFERERLAIDLLLGRRDLRPALEGGATLEEMERLWAADLKEFVERRKAFLLYDP